MENTGIGDAAGILGILLLMKLTNWKIAYEISMLLFLFFGVAMYLSI